MIKKASLLLLILAFCISLSTFLNINIIALDAEDPWGPKGVRIAQDMDNPRGLRDNIIAVEAEDPWNPKVIKLG